MAGLNKGQLYIYLKRKKTNLKRYPKLSSYLKTTCDDTNLIYIYRFESTASK